MDRVDQHCGLALLFELLFYETFIPLSKNAAGVSLKLKGSIFPFQKLYNMFPKMIHIHLRSPKNSMHRIIYSDGSLFIQLSDFQEPSQMAQQVNRWVDYLVSFGLKLLTNR